MGTLGLDSCGGGKRDRTADLLHAMQALSQLSYTPTANWSHCIAKTGIHGRLADRRGETFGIGYHRAARAQRLPRLS